MLSRNKGTVPWKIWLPPDLALEIERLTVNPITGRPQYAARSHLIVALLREFVKALDVQKAQPGFIKTIIDGLVKKGSEQHEPSPAPSIADHHSGFASTDASPGPLPPPKGTSG